MGVVCHIEVKYLRAYLYCEDDSEDVEQVDPVGNPAQEAEPAGIVIHQALLAEGRYRKQAEHQQRNVFVAEIGNAYVESETDDEQQVDGDLSCRRPEKIDPPGAMKECIGKQPSDGEGGEPAILQVCDYFEEISDDWCMPVRLCEKCFMRKKQDGHHDDDDPEYLPGEACGQEKKQPPQEIELFFDADGVCLVNIGRGRIIKRFQVRKHEKIEEVRPVIVARQVLPRELGYLEEGQLKANDQGNDDQYVIGRPYPQYSPEIEILQVDLSVLLMLFQ